MQEEEKKIEPMVDIDTSGPGADIELPEEKPETDVETVETKEDSSPAPQESAEEKVEASDEQQETKQEEKPVEKKEELEEYSAGVKRRIAKLTKKWREAERQREEAIKYAESVMANQTKLKNKISKLEPGFLSATEKGIDSGLEAAKAKLATAREAGDLNAEIEAQTAISELGYRKAKFLEAKAAQEDNAKPIKEQTLSEAIAPKPQAPDPKATEWAEKNPWFGTDNAMTYTAMDLHKKLTEEEGFDVTSDDYYAEIDKRIRLEFPHKFGKTSQQVEETTKPTQIVASAKRSVNKSGRKTVRLTPSQVAIAKKLGVPLEEYAKQMKITKEV